MRRHEAAPFDLPAPTNPAVRRAAELLTSRSADGGTLALAQQVGLSARTLERRFLSETGMTLAAWGLQARLLQSLRQLAAGDTVKAVAQAAGYRAPSGFVAAFRRGFGETPGRYFATPAAELGRFSPSPDAET